MTEFECGRIVTFLGGSGSGKTTQMGMLVAQEQFRMCPSTTTRPPRPSDLCHEYHYATMDEYQTLVRSGRSLWDIPTGNRNKAGTRDRYTKDICDIIEAFTDPDHVYVQGLIPKCAAIMARRYGAPLVRTLWLPSPPDDEVIARMVERGDEPEQAANRLKNEKNEGWSESALAIEGIYVITGRDKFERHEEIQDYIASS